MGAQNGRSAAGDDTEDPYEQPWGPRSGGRHSLGRRAAVVRVEELLRSSAVQPQPHQFNEAQQVHAGRDPRPDAPPGDEVVAARAEIERLTELLRAAQAELALAREKAEADAAARDADFDDLQTRWELHVRELEKDLEEMAGQLAQRAEGGQAAQDADQVTEELERLRAEAERARAEAEDAGAEADAAFVELAEAFAALSAAEARLAELESSTREQRQVRPGPPHPA